MKKILIITSFVIFLLFVIPLSIKASPPPYVGDPNCEVSGYLNEMSLVEGIRGEAYDQCINPLRNLLGRMTDCEWIIPMGDDKYLLNIHVRSSNGVDSKDDEKCLAIHPLDTDIDFSAKLDILNTNLIKPGREVLGTVVRGKEFQRVYVVNPDVTHYDLFSKEILLIFLSIALVVVIIIISIAYIRRRNKKKVAVI